MTTKQLVPDWVRQVKEVSCRAAKKGGDHISYISIHIHELLDAIDPASCTYSEWCEVGMALKYEQI